MPFWHFVIYAFHCNAIRALWVFQNVRFKPQITRKCLLGNCIWEVLSLAANLLWYWWHFDFWWMPPSFICFSSVYSMLISYNKTILRWNTNYLTTVVVSLGKFLSPPSSESTKTYNSAIRERKREMRINYCWSFNAQLYFIWFSASILFIVVIPQLLF